MFLQEQGHNIVLSDAESTFHAIKVTTIQYGDAFFPYLTFAMCNIFPLKSASDIFYFPCRHLAKVTEDGVMTQTVLNLAHLLLVCSCSY
jgi:hypothetical protein